MIIHLLNKQPKDTLGSMKEWLMTQFNTTLTENQEFRKDYSMEKFKNWKSDPQYQKRL